MCLCGHCCLAGQAFYGLGSSGVDLLPRSGAWTFNRAWSAQLRTIACALQGMLRTVACALQGMLRVPITTETEPASRSTQADLDASMQQAETGLLLFPLMPLRTPGCASSTQVRHLPTSHEDVNLYLEQVADHHRV